jgi:hypothetical protein
LYLIIGILNGDMDESKLIMTNGQVFVQDGREQEGDINFLNRPVKVIMSSIEEKDSSAGT